MKNLLFKKNNLAALIEYKLEYKEELKRIDQEAKRAVEHSRLFMGM
ncbi:hypothetical protein [Oceanirhabdus sp. W0125-5]|nr:hypothetical protein [Oceanirhabdus sp. W0125-5]WBW98878.1 hypothetical protein OW730_09085 [Oceanirhabdus sp. W0125-5]WBW98879.1 hypothetical protein OW730_09090 [Oceanirhabdus sp. W0125-5]WBW98883.1 hypothetical protein OW730_09110 [Oceanirhabdus sp. W0125-5]WBW98884.1 hypothetical protein OW730_09115 [Oceanirhabdus sp. W0125-5]WBW98885.1 hypothetical protein OW730_09120 [Oceanirhabdus sp. W0125-5]